MLISWSNGLRQPAVADDIRITVNIKKPDFSRERRNYLGCFMVALAALLVFCVRIAEAVTQPVQPVGFKVGVDSQSRLIHMVAANGIGIGYKLIGTGQPLVMINDLGRTMDAWPDQMTEQLSQKYQLIMLDNRGMGFTTLDGAKFSTKLFADDVVALLDALHVKKASVLGAAMGSIIAQELLLDHPERVDKVIIWEPCTD